MLNRPGTVRDSIIDYLSTLGAEATVTEILKAVERQLGEVPSSSVRSYLNLNTPELFERTGRGLYRLRDSGNGKPKWVDPKPVVKFGRAKLFHVDCFDWLANRTPSSIHAVVTDPPYGLLEYTEREMSKRSIGVGGVWRIPPSFDGHKRAPLPRFTVLNAEDHEVLHAFFKHFGTLLARVVVPGGNVIVASNPLLAHIVATAMTDAGLEMRGNITRLVMTMRGGDRPKNAHEEFSGVSVMPRSMWEPWVVLRRPLEGRVQDNLRKWKTGGFRRPSAEKPFGDVIKSQPTPRSERAIANHPSLKPQAFLRQVVRAVLPLGEGVVLDPFAGSSSTLAAAEAIGSESIGVESSAEYIEMAKAALRPLSLLPV